MKTMSSKTLAIGFRSVFGLLLLIAAFAVMGYLIKTKPQVQKSDLGDQTVRVQVMRAQPVDVARQWRGYGTTQAKDSADVPARINATVVAKPDGIEVGRVVQAGQVLAELDKTDFQNAYEAAGNRIAQADAMIALLDVDRQRLNDRLKIEEEQAQLARTDFQRQQDRIDSGAATQSDLDRAKTTLLTAESRVIATRQQIDAIPPRLAELEAAQAIAASDRDTAQANLERATIVSPIAGVIEALDIEVGESLAPGQRVARIVDPRILEVPLQLPASARSYVTVGNAVTLKTRSQPDDCPPWQAKVTRIGVVDGPTRTFTVYAEVNQSHIPLRNFAEGQGPYKLPVGAFTLARLDTAEPTQRTILPTRAIQEGRIRTIVNGKVVSRPIDVAFELEGDYPRFGLDDEQWSVLDQLLDPQTLVVLSASMSILDGQRVEAIVSNDAVTTPGDDKTQARRDAGEPQPASGETP